MTSMKFHGIDRQHFDEGMVVHSKEAYPTPMHAFVAEMVSNGITHTRDKLRPTMYATTKNMTWETSMKQTLWIAMNSDGTKYLNRSQPFDAKGVARIFDVGRHGGHQVIGDSQHNSGFTNFLFAFGKDCHGEIVIYDASTGTGAIAVHTRPVNVDGRSTRGMGAAETHQTFVAGFVVKRDAEGQPVGISFYEGQLLPEAFQCFLLNSRLTGPPNQSGETDIYAAKRYLESLLMREVVRLTEDADMPGDTLFSVYIDISSCTYTHPTTGETRPSFTKTPEGDMIYTEFKAGKSVKDSGSGMEYEMTERKVSFVQEVHAKYKTYDCPALSDWICANGARSRALQDVDIYILDDENYTHNVLEATLPFDTLTETMHRALHGASPMYSFTITMKATEADQASLNMAQPPDAVAVACKVFKSPAKDICGMGCMWRKQVRPSSFGIQTYQAQDESAVPLSREGIYGINSVNKQRDCFVQLCRLMRFEHEVLPPRPGGTNNRFYLTKAGDAEFKKNFGVHSEQFFLALEKAAETSGKPNDVRSAFYLMDTVIITQIGNMSPAFDKTSNSNDPLRWGRLCAEVVIRHTKYMAATFDLQRFYVSRAQACVTHAVVVPVADGGARGHAAASSSSASAVPNGRVEDVDAPMPIVVYSGPSRKRASGAPSAPPKKMRVNPENTEKRDSRKEEHKRLLGKWCFEFKAMDGQRLAEAEELEDGEVDSDMEMTAQRMKRVDVLETEVADGNLELLMDMPVMTYFSSDIAYQRAAFAQLFYMVTGGNDAPELGKLPRDLLNKLMLIHPGGMTPEAYMMRGTLKPSSQRADWVFSRIGYLTGETA